MRLSSDDEARIEVQHLELSFRDQYIGRYAVHTCVQAGRHAHQRARIARLHVRGVR